MALFGRKKKESKTMDMLMPINGEVVQLSTVPDPVFAEKMMGDGFAIIPSDGKIYAPFDAEIVTLFPTGHAIGLAANGVELLIHFGLDTVTLNGEGFTTHVKQGDKITAGQLLVEVDVEAVASKVPSIITPVIFTKIDNADYTVQYGNHAQGDVITTITI